MALRGFIKQESRDRLLSPDWRMRLAPIATVENLKAALTLAGSHDLGVAIAKLDLTNRPACCVKLAENDRRAIHYASRRPAGTQITASPDLNRRRRGIEVRLEHWFGLYHARLMSAMAGGVTNRLWSVEQMIAAQEQAV